MLFRSVANSTGTCNEEMIGYRCSCLYNYAWNELTLECDLCAEGYAEYPDCKPVVCVPGANLCIDETTNGICNEHGTGYVPDPCSVNELCIEGQCLDECERAEFHKSYVGCEYWGAFLQQFPDATPNYALVVSNPNDTAVTVTVYTFDMLSSPSGYLATAVVQPGTIHAFELGTTRLIQGPGIAKQAFRVVSDRPVTVTQMNPFGNIAIASNDATLLLPVGALGQNYVAMSWPYINRPDRTNHPGYISIVATEEGNTQVQITYSDSSKAGGVVNAQEKGDVVQYTLSQYDILTINTKEAGCNASTHCYGHDLTGSSISSDKKIAVFGGHRCVQIPADKCCCDHIEHQIPSTDTWGKEFAAARTKPRGTESDYYRILASQDNTFVEWTGGVSGNTTLNAGEVHDFSTTADFIVSSDKPVLLGQFLASQNAGANTGEIGRAHV